MDMNLDMSFNSITTLFQQVLFYCFALVAVFSAIFMIVAKNPVRSVLSLVVTFFAMGALWVLLGAEFLAMTLVLVYVGAVMVLFMFVIMMLDIEYATIRSGFIRYLPIGIIVSVLVAICLIYSVAPQSFNLETIAPPKPYTGESNVTALGTLLYTQYLYPFEIAGILLLVAIIAAISLTFRGLRNRKVQNPASQVSVTKEDRLRIVKMKEGT